MTQQPTPTQLAQNVTVKTEGSSTAAILTTTSNTPASLPPAIGSTSVTAQDVSSARQATTPSVNQSNITTTTTATAKNDPKTVEQSVAKLKQFLKNLVKLAEGRKKEVQDKVQSHVQHLLAGSLSEEQFAKNLESDLNSPHQPNLLPFLKSSVPHLRAALLQQKLMSDKQQNTQLVVDLEKQKVAAAALLMSQTKAAALQQLLQKQQAAQLKKEALDGVKSMTVTNASASSNNVLTNYSSRLSMNKPISTLANGTTPFSSNNTSMAKLQESKIKGKATMKGKTKKEATSYGDNSDDEDEEMEVAGVNLQEEAVHFLPPTVDADASDKKIEDVFLLHKEMLKQKILGIGRLHGVNTVSDDALSLISHATESRLKNFLSKLSVISQHRMKVLKDDSHYETTSQVREQLKFLEGVDRVHTKRKQEQEREKLLKAAKSKSKSDDPNLISIKEQAKKLQMEEEEQIRKRAANETALSAIGVRRKRPFNSSELQSSSTTGSSLGVLTGSSHKRRVTIRDLVFLMTQERETRKSPLLYKTLMK